MSPLRRRAVSAATQALALVLTTGAAPAADEAIHACTDASGRVIYQGDPCPDPAPAPAVERSKRPASPRSPVPVPVTSRRLVPPPRRAPLAAPAPAAERFSPDPLHGSPERTWRTFLGAMRGGDRDAALACLTPGGRSSYESRIGDLRKDRLHEAVDDYARYVLEGRAGPFWSIRVLRPSARPKWILFEEQGDGTWKIAAM